MQLRPDRAGVEHGFIALNDMLDVILFQFQAPEIRQWMRWKGRTQPVNRRFNEAARKLIPRRLDVG